MNKSLKKELSQYLEGNKTIYEDNIENKFKKELNNSYEAKNKNKGINKRYYYYYQDKEENEDYDISENNTPQEKPEKKYLFKIIIQKN